MHAAGGVLGGPGEQLASSIRFVVFIPAWSTGLGFSKLAGFNTTVESAEYAYSGGAFGGMFGNTLTKQIGRGKSPTITLERALDTVGFKQLLSWHMLARSNLPTARVPATFTIMDSAGDPKLTLELMNAWCSKLEVDPAQAGSSSVVNMRVTIECDSIFLS